MTKAGVYTVVSASDRRQDLPVLSAVEKGCGKRNFARNSGHFPDDLNAFFGVDILENAIFDVHAVKNDCMGAATTLCQVSLTT